MKRAFTLIELLVYMIIMGFIIVVAGRVFSDSTAMRVRSQNMVKAAEEIGKVANIIKEDISQTGTKSWGRDEATTVKVNKLDENGNFIEEDKTIYLYPITGEKDVYIDYDNDDFSSFELYRSEIESKANNDISFDRFVFKKAMFDAEGKYLGVAEVTWEVNDDGELRRLCEVVDGEVDDVCPNSPDSGVLIASNVKRFSFIASAPGAMPAAPGATGIEQNAVFPDPSSPDDKAFNLVSRAGDGDRVWIGVDYNEDYTRASLSGFAKNDVANSKKYNEVYLADINGSCINVPIKKGETYAVEFRMPFLERDNQKAESRRDYSSTQFLPGTDHIAVGLRDGNGNKIPQISSDVIVYAPQASDAGDKPRHAEFTANEHFEAGNSNICVTLTFSFYSPVANKGKLRFSDFKIYRKADGAYHFVKEENNYKEEFANEYATTDGDPSHKANVKAFEFLLEIDKNGEVAGTYSKESTGMVIPVPNNGVR